MREQLQRAVRGTEVPPYLAARVRAQIDGHRKPRLWNSKVAWVAATAAVILGLGVAYQIRYLRSTVEDQQSYIASMSSQVAALMRIGLGDHIHCAFFRKYPQNPPSTEQFVQSMGPEYSGLIPLVRKHIPETYHMDLAHLCRFDGRQFVHLVLRNDQQLLSLVITKKSPGESFETSGLLPALAHAGIPIYNSGVEHFQIASFESRDHLVYLISDLGAQRNTQLMLALAPDVRAFLKKMEL